MSTAETITPDQLLWTAEHIARKGCSIIPIDPRTKKPASWLLPKSAEGKPTWAPFQTTAATEDVYIPWLVGDRSTKAYAIVCGAISGGLTIIDFDVPRLYTAWCEAVGDLADGLPVQQTGGGNYQVALRSSKCEGNQKLAYVPDESADDGRTIGIETRGEGGYAVGPGSLHPSGNIYKCIAGSFGDIPTIPPARRDALLDAARRLDEAPFTRQELEIQAIEAHRRAIKTSRNGSAGVIDAFNEQHPIESLLETYGYTKGRGKRFKRPGGESESVSVKDGCSCHHSSNDELNNGRGANGCGVQDAFSIYAHFEHSGDVTAAVRAAAEKLGMSHPKNAAKQHGSVSPTSKRAPYPVLHDDAMYGLAGDIVRAIEPHTEADPVAVLVQTLVGFGSAAGRSAYSTADAARHGMNEFCVMVGKTSKGRKGTSWENSRVLLNGADPDWAENHIVSGLSSGEGLIWAVRDEVRKRVPVKSKGRFTGDHDEVVEHEGIKDKRLLIMEGELATPLKSIQRDGNTLSPILRAAWDSNSKLRSLTKNSPACATGAHISLIGHITADELLRLLDATEAANGLGNRFLWVCVERSKCLPDGGQIHNVDFSDISRRLSVALANAKTAELITRDSEARELWHKVYPALSEGGHGLAGSLTSRGEAHVMRLSMIYALLDASRVVRLPHMKAALALWKYCEASVFHLFGTSLGDPLADRLLSLISFNSSGITKTEISDHFGKNITADRLDRALEILRSSSLIISKYQKIAKGRPIQRWFAVTDTGNELNEVNEQSPQPNRTPENYEQLEREAIEGGA